MSNKLSFDQRRTIVSDALNAGRTGVNDARCYIREMFEDMVIFWDETKASSEKLFRANYVIKDDNTADITNLEQVKEVTNYEVVAPATFSVESFTVMGDVVRYFGKIFQSGDYPDKNFSLTDEEQVEAAKDFSGPVFGNYEHKKGVLDGELGQLVEVKTEGSVMFGSYDMPTWLHKKVGGKAKVSLEWNRELKKIVGVALTLNPRITDAEIVAAFSESTNDSDVSDAERTGKKPMKEKGLIAKIVALFSKLTPEELADLESADDAASSFTEDSDEVKALKAKNAELEAKLRKPAAFDNGPKIAAAAAKFAADLVIADKATPAESDELIALYTQVAESEFDSTVDFSADASTGLLASFVARENKRPVLGLQADKLKDLSIVNSDGNDSTADFSKECDELLQMTHLGRRTLALRKGN